MTVTISSRPNRARASSIAIESTAPNTTTSANPAAVAAVVAPLSGMATPFASSSQQADKLTHRGVEMTATAQPAQRGLSAQKSYKLVKSPTGNNLYVENAEYDPYAHHNKHSDKGEGLGFMFFCCRPKVKEPREQVAERHYSIAQSPSMDNIPNKAE